MRGNDTVLRVEASNGGFVDERSAIPEAAPAAADYNVATSASRYSGEPLVRRSVFMPDMDSAFRIFQTHWRVTGPGWSRPWHDHPMFELNLVLDGEQDVRVGEAAYTMGKGDILVVPPGMPHRVTGIRGDGVTYFALHFDVEDYMFRAILGQYRCGFHRYGSETERDIRKPLNELIERIKACENGDLAHPAIRLQLMSHAFALFAALGSAELPEHGGQDGRANRFLIAYRMAGEIESMVKAGVDENAGLTDGIARLAEKLGYSSSYLCRVFRSVFGVSPRKYRSNATIHRARLELLDPNQSMERIAEKLGFRDGAHFSKQFKRWTGRSPSEYRQSQQTLLLSE